MSEIGRCWRQEPRAAGVGVKGEKRRREKLITKEEDSRRRNTAKMVSTNILKIVKFIFKQIVHRLTQ